MLQKRNRISSKFLISKLQRKGDSYKTRHLVFKFFPSQFSDSQFAISISKKVSNKAVRRNRLKRQIAHGIVPLIPTLKEAFVVLVILKNSSPDTQQFEDLQAEIKQFFNHIRSDV